MSDREPGAIFTCPKCGLSGSGPESAEIRCAGVKAWGTAHKPCSMEIVERLKPARTERSGANRKSGGLRSEPIARHYREES